MYWYITNTGIIYQTYYWYYIILYAFLVYIKHIYQSVGMIIPNIWKNKKCCIKHITGWWCNVPILKNDGVRQWEGLFIPYMKWKIIQLCLKPPTSYIYIYIHCIVTNSMCIFVHVPYHMKSTCTIQKSQPNQHPTSRWLLAKLVYRWIT